MTTTTQEIEKLLHDYREWLKDKTTLRELNGEWVEITTPYLDRHNDMLQIYVRAENGGYVLTDDSYTVHDLEASGCNLHTEKRQDLLSPRDRADFSPPETQSHSGHACRERPFLSGKANCSEPVF